MVRENKIHAAAVNIQGEIGPGHGRALDVPAGTSFAPRAFPVRFPGLGRFPDGEVERIALLFAGSDARAGKHVVDVPVRKLAVLRECADAEVHVAGRRRVGRALIDERLADVDDVLDVFRRPGFDVGAFDAERVHVFVEGVDVRFGDFLPVLMFRIGAADDLVVHVSEVAHEGDVEPLAAQEADENIEHESRARMTDVAEIVDGDAADVHVNFAGTDGNELFLASGRCIENLHEISFVDAV